jgi:hypothetical protein
MRLAATDYFEEESGCKNQMYRRSASVCSDLFNTTAPDGAYSDCRDPVTNICRSRKRTTTVPAVSFLLTCSSLVKRVSFVWSSSHDMYLPACTT